jgi:hypothetical protein
MTDTPQDPIDNEDDIDVPSKPAEKQEHPLVNIMVNVLVPVMILNYLSKPDRLGPVWALIVAVSLPVGYGIWYAVTKKKANFFSILGMVSILLTGVLGLNQTKAIWFALKEAFIPAMFGTAILGSFWTKNPLINTFLINPDLFDLKRIKKRVAANSNETAYRNMEFQGTLMLAGSMYVSSVANYFLAMYFLDGKEADQVAYTEAIGKLTGYGFLVIGVPMLVVMVATLMLILKKMKQLTGLDQDKIFLPK